MVGAAGCAWQLGALVRWLQRQRRGGRHGDQVLVKLRHVLQLLRAWGGNGCRWEVVLLLLLPLLRQLRLLLLQLQLQLLLLPLLLLPLLLRLLRRLRAPLLPLPLALHRGQCVVLLFHLQGQLRCQLRVARRVCVQAARARVHASSTLRACVCTYKQPAMRRARMRGRARSLTRDCARARALNRRLWRDVGPARRQRQGLQASTCLALCSAQVASSPAASLAASAQCLVMHMPQAQRT